MALMDRQDITTAPKEGPLASPDPLCQPPSADDGALELASSSHETQHDILNRISDELSELDMEEEEFIRSIKRKRLALRRLWNSALPIHKLPDELLIRLFVEFQGAIESYRFPGRKRGGPLGVGWLDLMVVCRRWRDILVSTPAFWRTVNLRRPIHWTKLCLSRSVPASIDVSTRHRDQCPLEVIFPHVRRFRTFLFEAPYDSQLERSLSHLFGNGMPLLEDLTFSVFEKPPAAEVVDADLTSRRFPFLRALTLRATVAPQDVSLYSQLHELSLTLCSHPGSFEGFLDALATCVQLERLTLWNALPHLPVKKAQGPIPSSPLITLPRLREFTLVDHGTLQTSRFLAHVYLYPSVVLMINTAFRDAADTEDVKGINVMLPPNRSSALPVLAAATHVEISVMYIEYEISCGYGHLIDPQTGSPISGFKANIPDDNDPIGWDMGLRDLVECFGRAPLTWLKLHSVQPQATVHSWERVFRTFPLLEELHIDSDDEASRVFLALHAASSGAHEDSSVACQDLRHVSVAGAGMVRVYEAMRECFQHRAERGARLHVLDLRFLINRSRGPLATAQRCGFVEDLRRAVECVHAKDN